MHDVARARRARRRAGSSIGDDDFLPGGAPLGGAPAAWARADLVLKVKEPLPAESPILRAGLVLFTYLHLAAEPASPRTDGAPGPAWATRRCSARPAPCRCLRR